MARAETEIAANRAYPSIDELAARAVTWLVGMTDADRLRRGGLQSSKFAWLPT